MPHDREDDDLLQSVIGFKCLLAATPGLSAEQLRETFGIDADTVRRVLEAGVATGQLRAEGTGSGASYYAS